MTDLPNCFRCGQRVSPRGECACKDNCCVLRADCRDVLPLLEPGCVDLVLGSPPYEDCRTYGIGFALRGQAWVDWMVGVVRDSVTVCRGLTAFVVEGQTRKYRWSATPAMLLADLHRAGICLRKPMVFQRHGIPGGSPDFPRGDWEHIVCATPGGRIPWVDLKAMGTPCKYKTGGAFSYRHADGRRVNEKKHLAGSAAIKSQSPVARKGRPKITKPGDVIRLTVGKGHMGDSLAHENEAPFPEKLAEFFIRTFCPPGGLVLDPFCGSGTTAAVAKKLGRRAITCDVRDSQCEIAANRLRQEVLF